MATRQAAAVPPRACSTPVNAPHGRADGAGGQQSMAPPNPAATRTAAAVSTAPDLVTAATQRRAVLTGTR